MKTTDSISYMPCSCGMEHRCSIRHVVIGPNALSAVPEVTASYKHILVVADNNTYLTCGSIVEDLLQDRRAGTCILTRQGLLIPNEEAIHELRQALAPETDLILGIGSGVVQDLCKYVSFYAGLPYHIIATAPSMDGYASTGAAMILGSMKITCATHVPEAIIGDVNILKNAPMEMIQAGYGDILGKFSCLNDWKLSAVVRGEHFCQNIYDKIDRMLQKTKDLGPQLLQRNADAIGTLTEALVEVGIAMAYVGNSRPASGSEHHLSHYFEITGLLNHTFYFSHGIDVVYSAVYTQRLREVLLQMDRPVVSGTHDPLRWEAEIRRIYTDAAPGVIELQQKLGWYRQNRYPIYAEKWEEILAVLREPPSSDTMIRYLSSIGLKLSDFEAAYDTRKLTDGIRYAKDLKDRYSVLWLYYDLMHEGV